MKLFYFFVLFLICYKYKSNMYSRMSAFANKGRIDPEYCYLLNCDGGTQLQWAFPIEMAIKTNIFLWLSILLCKEIPAPKSRHVSKSTAFQQYLVTANNFRSMVPTMVSKTTFHFLVHYLHRPEYDIPTGQDDNVRQTIMLAEEFLNLLLIILGNVIFMYMYVKRKKNQLFCGIIFICGAQFS